MRQKIDEATANVENCETLALNLESKINDWNAV
jgi:hypothetical protein